MTHEWTRPLPSECSIFSIRFRREWLDIELYCREGIVESSINTLNGRIELKDRREPELKGVVERKGEVYVATAYRGFGNKLWTKTLKGLSVRFLCKTELCVLSILKPNRELEASLLDKDGETIDTVVLRSVYDYDLRSSHSMIALSTIGFGEESTSTLLIDPSTASIVDHITGYGGYVVACLDHVIVNGYRDNRAVAKVFSSEGEEVLEVDGKAVLPPYNPFVYQLDGSERFEVKKIVLIDKYEVKVFDPYDYSMIYTVSRPPFTRGVLDIDVEEYRIVSLSHLMGKPLILEFDFRGSVKWVSHVIHGFRYGLVSSDMVSLYFIGDEGGETRIYSIEDNNLIHEDSFGGNVYPIALRKNRVILTNEKLISSYVLE